MANAASLIAGVVLLGVLAAAAFGLRRYRDTLMTRMSKGPMILLGTLHLGDGTRLCLIEVDGVKLVCGLGRRGVGAISVVAPFGPSGDPS